ncbi:hypothetical protein O9929_13270 [Vibrio lentus]|nr:hypothetical protein [Vibrio lentus]
MNQQIGHGTLSLGIPRHSFWTNVWNPKFIMGADQSLTNPAVIRGGTSFAIPNIGLNKACAGRVATTPIARQEQQSV